MHNYRIILLTSFVLIINLNANSQTSQKFLGAWGKEDNSSKTIIILTDNIISAVNYNLVEHKFNYTWGGKYQLDKKNIKILYEWNSLDTSVINKSITTRITLKKNGEISIGNLLTDLTQLDNGKTSDLFGAWIISGNFINDVVSKRTNPFFPRRTMKIISGKYFHWVSYNVVNKKFFDAGGGTQTTQNGNYIENIEYFTKTPKSVGKSLPFSYAFIDGEWRHKGQKSTGGPLDECWTKRNVIEEKYLEK